MLFRSLGLEPVVALLDQLLGGLRDVPKLAAAGLLVSIQHMTKGLHLVWYIIPNPSDFCLQSF